MKTIIAPFIMASLSLLFLSNGQTKGNTYYPLRQDSIVQVSPEEDTSDYALYPGETQEKEEIHKGDTTFITVANKRIQIIEEDGETEVKIKDLETGEDHDFDFDDDAFNDEGKSGGKKKWQEFKGHWAGFEFGLNNYVSNDFSLNHSPESDFLELNTGKSWNFNLNFCQYSLGFGTDRAGIVTGMGLEWCNYHFSDTNSIMKLDRQIAPRPIPDNIKKNRLQTTYLTVPLILEVQFLEDHKGDRAYIGAGVIGGVKLFSNTKIKYVENGTNQKEKIKDDFYLSPLRYAFTARLGYKALKLFMNYYPTPLFMKDKHSEELYPVAAGLAITF